MRVLNATATLNRKSRPSPENPVRAFRFPLNCCPHVVAASSAWTLRRGGYPLKTPRICYRMSLILPPSISRRAFLAKAGIGSLALTSLLQNCLTALEPPWRGVLPQPHFPPRAKRVIWLTMAGGPSHLETFDHKPKLRELHGKPMPESFTKG